MIGHFTGEGHPDVAQPLGFVRRTPFMRLVKAVYVLTSDGRDPYSLMTWISLVSLRLSNPAVSTVILADESTYEKIGAHCPFLLAEVDSVIPVATPEGSPAFRNRHVKTRMRELVDGPFLFLDSDTLIRASIGHLLSSDADISLSSNHSQTCLDSQIWESDFATYSLLDWPSPTGIYYNGGVISFSDSQAARTFCGEWHRLWRDSFQGTGSYRDQPALNEAIRRTNPSVRLLESKFNAQFRSNPKASKNATIWHYYYSQGSRPTTGFEILLERLCRGDSLSPEDVESIVSVDEPWRLGSPLDRLIHLSIRRSGRLSRFSRTWLEGNRIFALKEAVMGSLKRLILMRSYFS